LNGGKGLLFQRREEQVRLGSNGHPAHLAPE
jgi:hypothetical protein